MGHAGWFQLEAGWYKASGEPFAFILLYLIHCYSRSSDSIWRRHELYFGVKRMDSTPVSVDQFELDATSVSEED
jgi:hypothetical protein